MYNPQQRRGADGRFIAVGSKRAPKRIRSAANKKKYAERRAIKRSISIRVEKAASRQLRGAGLSGLKKNITPYARLNAKSATAGVNTGTFIPFTNKRVAFGSYLKFESVSRAGGIAKRTIGKIAPEGSLRDRVGKHIAKNASMGNASIRYGIPGIAEARLGTSRKSGATLIVRRGKHKSSISQSQKGIEKFNSQMKSIQGKKVSKSRAARRKKK